MSASERLEGGAAAVALMLCAGAILASTPSGPYLVWANLQEASRPNINRIIKNYVDPLPGDEFCEEHAYRWIIYIHSRPPGLPDDLIHKALNYSDKDARHTIAKNLQAFRDARDINEGLDGIIAYSETGKPHMVSVDARGKVARSLEIHDPSDVHQVISAFCSVMPNVYRK